MQVASLTRNRFGIRKENYTETQLCNAKQLSLFEIEASEEENKEIVENIEKITVSDNKKKSKSKKSPKSGLKKSVLKNAVHEIKIQ